MFLRDTVEHTIKTALHQRPEALNRVGVDIPAYVDTLSMIDATVAISQSAKRLVGREVIGIDGRARQDSFLHDRQERGALCVLNRHHGNTATALHHPEHGLLVRALARTATLRPAATATDI